MRVLGPVEVMDDAGVPVAVGSRNQRLVLAVLACQRGRTVAAAHLIDALWGEPPRTADHSLRAYVSRLRHVLGDRLAIRPGGYALDLAPDAVDASRFEALLREAEGSGPAAVELSASTYGGARRSATLPMWTPSTAPPSASMSCAWGHARRGRRR